MNKGGRGCKAPYDTYIARIPKPLESVIDRITDEWKFFISIREESSADRYLKRVKAISNANQDEIKRILQEGLNCPNNNSRGAKEAIRAALQLMGEDDD
jgi:hypothetical protein